MIGATIEDLKVPGFMFVIIYFIPQSSCRNWRMAVAHHELNQTAAPVAVVGSDVVSLLEHIKKASRA